MFHLDFDGEEVGWRFLHEPIHCGEGEGFPRRFVHPHSLDSARADQGEILLPPVLTPNLHTVTGVVYLLRFVQRLNIDRIKTIFVNCTVYVHCTVYNVQWIGLLCTFLLEVQRNHRQTESELVILFKSLKR